MFKRKRFASSGRKIYLKAKKKRKPLNVKRALKIFLIALFFAAIVGGTGTGAYYLLTLPKFEVAGPNIESADFFVQTAVEERVSQYLATPVVRIFRKSNIFLLSPTELLAALRNVSPKVWHIEAHKDLPNTLRVNVLLREKAAVWCEAQIIKYARAEKNGTDEKEPMYNMQNKQCFNIDSQGVLFEEAKWSVNPLALSLRDGVSKDLSIGEKLDRTNILEYILKLRKEFVEEIGFVVDYFFVDDAAFNDINVMISDGYFIKTNIAISPDVTVSNYQNMLQLLKEKKVDKIEYIDLRFPDRIYYKAGEIKYD